MDGVVFAKGYADTTSVTHLAENFDQAQRYTGNFCLVKFTDSGIAVTHNKNRGFPLRYSEHSLTNLFRDRYPIWADEAVNIDQNRNITVEKQTLDTVISPDTLTVEQAVVKITTLLLDSAKTFFAANQPQLKLFLSGGVDTLLIKAIMDRCQYPYQQLTDFHYESDDFVETNHLILNCYWAYKQLHHWAEPSWLATGACGDEYFLRGPNCIALITAWHDIDFFKLLSQHPEAYHYKHFNRYTELWKDTWQQRNKIKDQYPLQQDLYQQVLNILLNDHQHWHLGNTLTWTPFKNIEIAKILLCCNIDDLIQQFTDAGITKHIINHLNPNLLQGLSKFKNVDSSENLHLLE